MTEESKLERVRRLHARVAKDLRDYVPGVHYYGPDGSAAALDELLDHLESELAEVRRD